MVSWIVDHVLGAPPWLVYVIVGLVVFAEDALFIGFVIPGETLAVIGGVTASLGHTNVWVVGVIVVLAAIIGDSVGFEIGRIWGARLLGHRLLDSRRPQLDKAQDFLRRRGGSAVFLGRWTAFFRAVMPALAGASRMPYPKFLMWNAVGGIAWGVTMVTVGYLAGQSYHRIEKWIGRGGAVVVALVVVAGIVVWQVRRRRAEREPDPV
jgi:membrane-associated protein